jgi:membrane protein implicated in regulation of membrane protease activity
MPDYLIWLIAGFLLIIIEVMTGTFYLLVLGVAAFAGALAAYLGFGAFAQVAFTGAVAILGLIAVSRWRKSRPDSAQKDRSLDVGQAVILESWLDQNNKRVRVKYRGASWDARLIGDANAQISDTLFICGTDGSELQVSRSPVSQ